MNNIFSLYDVEKLELKNYNLQRYLDIKKSLFVYYFLEKYYTNELVKQIIYF